jgi:hypothetical protein
MKYWEIIADRLHAQGWSYGIAEHFTQHGFLYCVDAHRDGKRFIVKADDLLTAFLSLERDAIAPKEAMSVTQSDRPFSRSPGAKPATGNTLLRFCRADRNPWTLYCEIALL